MSNRSPYLWLSGQFLEMSCRGRLILCLKICKLSCSPIFDDINGERCLQLFLAEIIHQAGVIKNAISREI